MFPFLSNLSNALPCAGCATSSPKRKVITCRGRTKSRVLPLHTYPSIPRSRPRATQVIGYTNMELHKSDDNNFLATPLHPSDDSPTLSPEDVDAQAAAIDVPDDTGEGGKLRMIVQLVKRSFGVKDLAAM
jgi:hypothetical protein